MIGNDPAYYNPKPVVAHAPEARMYEQIGEPRKTAPF